MRVHGHSALVLLLTCSILSLSASTASAQNEYGLGDPAAYLALSWMASFDDRGDMWFWNWDEGDSSLGWLDGGNGGLTGRAGFRLGPSLAIELQGDWVDLQDWEDNENWTITMNFRVYPTQYEPLGLKGILPDRLQPYGVVGAGVMGGTGDRGDNYQLVGAFRLGVGGDFYLTEQLALSFGYEWLTGTSYFSEKDTRNLAIGLQYNF